MWHENDDEKWRRHDTILVHNNKALIIKKRMVPRKFKYKKNEGSCKCIEWMGERKDKKGRKREREVKGRDT